MVVSVDPTKAWSTKAHPFSLHANALDLIDIGKRGFGVPVDTIAITEIGANGTSSMSFTYQDALRVQPVADLARVQLNDHSANEVLFAGFLMGRRMGEWRSSTAYSIDCTATDYSYLLDTTFVPALSHKAGASDKTLIQSVIAHAMRHPTIYTHSAFCTSTNASMPAMDFSHISLRAAIEAIQAASGDDRHYYVDFLGRLHYYLGPTESAMGAAPFVITDAPGGAQRASEGLHVEFDSSKLVNAVYIFGGNPTGSGWVLNEPSIKLYGQRDGTFMAPHSLTAAHKASVGLHFLKLHKDPITRGSFKTTGSDAGWRVGQTVTVTSVPFGLSSATYPIVQIDTIFKAGTGLRERTIYFGDLPASGRRVSRPHPAAATTTGPSVQAAPQPAARIVGHSGAAADKKVH